MAAVSNSVVHLTMRYQKTELSIGSGVIYQHGSDYFIVTAWHNLSGRHSETLKPLSKNLAIPDNVVVSLAVRMPSFGATTRHSIVIPLTDEDKSLFYIHPENWPRVDVAVIPFDPSSTFLSELYLSNGEQQDIGFSPIMEIPGAGTTEICPIQKYLVPNPDVIEKWFDTVEVTEELFIPGYPHNVQDYYAQPVWKRATIASSIRDGWNREPKFLIDSASKSGMSGAPVLYYNPNGRVQILGSTYQFDQDIAILAGIYVGRIAVNGEQDPQIGTVWKSSVIEEIIEAQNFEKLPFDIELSHDEMIESMQSILATCSSKGLENIRNKKLPSRYYVRQELMKKISGRANPEDALAAVLDAAENYTGELVADNE
ncbi:hypothetical protein L2596_004461 [Vibrio vulnificus]|uniref:hypothetical protein n=1 Tax=Vibrio vulnificus TaxID=672 RepID=UPI002932F6B4|nr:hypothetical protein [Vibrio vulnificus]EIT6978209.1 hypothetical protein [Vibrio vulnificus]EIY9463409.1 hypothetical protein [Vibrio vulnificus]ELP5730663.1 hypothetical protein [Vibrio vulnificus]